MVNTGNEIAAALIEKKSKEQHCLFVTHPMVINFMGGRRLQARD